MKAEIITSGTELLLGEVVDINTPYLARELAQIGINVYHHTTVGDNPGRLLDAIKIAESRTDIIIISGGLGPTEDDITKSILAEHVGTKLVLDEESARKANKRYSTDKLSEGNYRQALVLEGSTPLLNDIGMAAGIFMETDDKIFVLLPGVPHEFEHMVNEYLLPKLTKLSTENHILRSRNLNFYGLPEAVVAEKLSELIKNQTNPTLAIYAKDGIIDVRITASAKSEEECEDMIDEMEEKVLAILEDNFFGYSSTRLQDVIFEELASNNETIALLEIQTEGEVLDGLVQGISHKDAFKGGLYFTNVEDSRVYFNETDDYSNSKEVNESYAKQVMETFNSDYGVVVIGYGKNEQSHTAMSEKVFVSLANKNGGIKTFELDLTTRSYFARWLLTLKVSDIIRRELLDLPEAKAWKY